MSDDGGQPMHPSQVLEMPRVLLSNQDGWAG